ncbi:MAG: winged helix-turn-helix domain-containing protein [Euryarchaeota archaeon]|nr:winged helix-turn-helix domain-containing protein [Euryarchaeota archaeon]
MKLNDIFKQFDESKDNLKFLASSNVRLDIMFSLNEESKSLRTLKNEINLSSSTILRAINQLYEENIVTKEYDLYSLSHIGKIIVFNLIKMMKSIVSVKKFEELWLDHEIGGITEDLLKEIDCLSDSVLIKSEDTEIFKPYSNYLKLISEVKHLKGISPIFHPDFIEVFNNLLDRDIDIQLILTREVLDKTIESSDKESMKKAILKKNPKFWEWNEDLKLAFTVTDNFVSLGLFLDDGTFDANRDLVGTSKEAIYWGNRLFNHYLEQAEEIKLWKHLKVRYLLKLFR